MGGRILPQKESSHKESGRSPDQGPMVGLVPGGWWQRVYRLEQRIPGSRKLKALRIEKCLAGPDQRVEVRGRQESTIGSRGGGMSEYQTENQPDRGRPKSSQSQSQGVCRTQQAQEVLYFFKLMGSSMEQA